jgi:hypothetical protein
VIDSSIFLLTLASTRPSARAAVCLPLKVVLFIFLQLAIMQGEKDLWYPNETQRHLDSADLHLSGINSRQLIARLTSNVNGKKYYFKDNESLIDTRIFSFAQDAHVGDLMYCGFEIKTFDLMSNRKYNSFVKTNMF